MKNFYSFILGLLLIGSTTSLNAQVNETDSLALVDFYNATCENGAWSDSWLATDVPVDDWAGVTVTVVNGEKRVTEISTEGLNLDGVYPSGTIPTSIGNLSALTVLKLIGVEPQDDNDAIILDLNGSIPEEIWKLTNLTKLQIKFTNLTGGIPDGIESMVNLQEINFQQTYLNCEIPEEIFELPSLVKAYLHQSNFIGQVPETVTKATNLKRLYLQDNHLEAGLPFVTLNADNNPKVNLTGNYFSFDDVADYHDATYYGDGGLTDDYQYAQADAYNRYTTGDAASFSLEIADADVYNWFFNDGTTPVTASSNTHSISSISADDEGTYTLKAQSTLVSNFDIRANFIAKVADSDVSGLEKDELSLLDFYYSTGGNWSSTWGVEEDLSNWDGVVVSEFDGVQRVTELSTEGLNLHGVYPSGTIPSTIGDLDALTVLKLIGLENGPVVLDLNGSIPEEIWNLTNLTKLQIKYTNLSGGIPDGVESMVNLEEINFQQTYLNCEIPEEIFELPSLKKAYLHQSGFIGKVPETLTEATNLTRLYLQDNHLESGLPFVDVATNGGKVNLTGNYFTFADVQQYHDADYGDGKITDDYQYAQPDEYYHFTTGDAVSFSLNIDNTDSYNWFFGEETTPVTTGSNTHSISSVTTDNVGTYTLKAQSSLVSNFDIRANFIINNVSGSDITALEADSLALVDFYLASGGNWSSTWLVNPISEWDGLVVAEVNGENRVTELSTEGTNKNGVYPSGTLSASIGDLSALTILKIIGQESGPVILDIHGSIPEEIWDLTSLTKLQIKYTNLTGGIPDGIESMTNLQEINFQQTYLNCEIPEELFELPALTKAYLHQSDFTGKVPETLTKATNLKRLYLQDNQLEAGLPYVNVATNGGKVELTGNYFTFADVQPYHDADYGDGKITDDYQYAQAAQHYTYAQGESATFSLTVDDAAVYNWFLADATSNPVTAGSNTHTISSISTDDAGTYYTCRIQSSLVSNFEIRAEFYIDEVTASSDVNGIDKTEVNYQIWPNPCTTNLYIDAESDIQSVSIYNTVGTMVSYTQYAGSNNITIPVSELKMGLYILKIETINGTVVERIIKK